MRRPTHSKRMAEAAARKDICSIRQVAHGLNYQGWMDLAESVRTMVATFRTRCVNLSVDNLLYDTKTNRCSLADEREVKHEGDPIKLRWYPLDMWDAWDEICYNYDIIAALVVLELIYGDSPFYHKDEAQFRANIRDQFRAVGPKNCRNLREKSAAVDFTDYGTRKAIWVLTYTFTGAAQLDVGLNGLKTCARCMQETEEHVIENWDYQSRRRMPAPEVQPAPEAHVGECDSITSASSSASSSPSNANPVKLRSDQRENKKPVDAGIMSLLKKIFTCQVPCSQSE